MDAATVRKMISDAEKRGAARVAAIDTAKRDVFPHVGEVVGLDSAEAIYAFALKAKGIETKGVHPSAFKSMVAMIPGAPEPIALDRLTVTESRLDKITSVASQPSPGIEGGFAGANPLFSLITPDEGMFVAGAVGPIVGLMAFVNTANGLVTSQHPGVTTVRVGFLHRDQPAVANGLGMLNGASNQ
ncbi:hypothetical protein LTR94_030139, partial [Friedmanniomyces endolithicus]